MCEVEVVIEIAKGGHIKYEYDKKINMLVCDRVLHTPMKYPFNYGFIPNTLSEDGDALDAVVLMDDSLVPGCVIKCKILGYLETSDDEGNDPKIIVCPIGKIDPMWNDVNDLAEILNKHQEQTVSCENNKNKNMTKINNPMLNQIKYFFQHYKDLENKNVVVGDFYDKSHGIKIYADCKNRVKSRTIIKNKKSSYFDRV